MVAVRDVRGVAAGSCFRSRTQTWWGINAPASGTNPRPLLATSAERFVPLPMPTMADLVLGNEDAMGPKFTNVTLLSKPGTAPKLYRLDAGAAFDFAPDGSRSVKKFKQDYSDVKGVSDLGLSTQLLRVCLGVWGVVLVTLPRLSVMCASCAAAAEPL
jgi:hypothetical protein